MTRRHMAGLAAGLAGLTLAACTALAPEPTPSPPSPAPSPEPVVTKPADDPQFARALDFDCGAGGKVQVVQGGNIDQPVLLRRDGGAAKSLPFEKTATDGPGVSWKLADVRFTLNMGEGAVYEEGGKTYACAFKSRSLPAPATADVVQTVTEADAGKTVTLKAGEKFAVALVGVPTAGYLWGADAAPAFLKVSEGGGGATSTSQYLPGFTGGSHWEVLIVEALKAGEGELVLAQRRPWEPKSEPGAETFKVKVKVQ